MGSWREITEDNGQFIPIYARWSIMARLARPPNYGLDINTYSGEATESPGEAFEKLDG